ncbi:MAG: TonB terminal [Candidatus Hydrogenedentota bacterium]
MLPARLGPGPAPEPEPLVLNLREEDERMIRQVVEAVTPADTPPEDARLIARENTTAADQQLRDGAQDGPAAEIEARVETLARTANEPQSVTPTPTPQPMPKPEVEPVAPPTTTATPTPEKPDVPQVAAAPPALEPDQAKRPPQVERMQVAQAKPVVEAPRQEAPSKSRGALNNRVINKGFASYEAIQDEAAAYLEQVKARVEKEWREALLLRYSGVLPRSVNVDCEIAADGRLVSVTYAETPEDRLFGSICLDAIRRAGPFPPFNFEVPEIYRNQNLEIRWHFNFL